MPTYQLLQIGLQVLWVLFAIAIGGCVGSLINVLAYRIPLGKSVVTPPSACPRCAHRLAWYDNLPVIGWLVLRGRCRYCKEPISPEYPIVEGVVAILFGVVFTLYMIMPADFVWLGVPWGEIRPEWARLPHRDIWPIMLVIMSLVGCLAAVTIIDAKTYMIPLAIPWFATIVAVLGHAGLAAWLEYGKGYTYLYDIQHVPHHLVPPYNPFRWSMPIPRGDLGAPLFGSAVGGILGLGIATLLLRLGLIRRSFDDYEEWERATLAERAASEAHDAIGDVAEIASAADAPPATPESTSIGEAQIDSVAKNTALSPDTPELWIQYPHARREMLKELVFLAPCVALMIGGGALAHWLQQNGHFPMPPLWTRVLAGVLIGYLVGGGIVWAVRILGSLAFGKEAMGLGDVHLWAAVGACLGWIDATIGFFLAAPVGLVWVLVTGLVGGGKFAKTMPYGPYLAAATLLVLLGKPLIEIGLNWLIGGGSIGQPGALSQPINLP